MKTRALVTLARVAAYVPNAVVVAMTIAWATIGVPLLARTAGHAPMASEAIIDRS
jgi:hypothetical protein